MSNMPRPLADDADALIKECTSYMDSLPVVWIKGVHYLQVNPGLCVPLNGLDAYFSELRESILRKIIQHLFDEVGQDQYTSHGSKSTYNSGCRGLLCRRANREAVRTHTGSASNAKYRVADAMLEEAEARILPEEVVGHVRYTDRVAAQA